MAGCEDDDGRSDLDADITGVCCGGDWHTQCSRCIEQRVQMLGCRKDTGVETAIGDTFMRGVPIACVDAPLLPVSEDSVFLAVALCPAGVSVALESERNDVSDGFE